MSTESSIALMNWKEGNQEHYLHFYNECMESDDKIYLNIFLMGKTDNFNETYLVPKDELLELTEQLVIWRSNLKAGE